MLTSMITTTAYRKVITQRVSLADSVSSGALCISCFESSYIEAAAAVRSTYIEIQMHSEDWETIVTLSRTTVMTPNPQLHMYPRGNPKIPNLSSTTFPMVSKPPQPKKKKIE